MFSSDLYLLVREREGRLYPDEVVARLPEVSRDHPLKTEWIARAASLRRLTQYFKNLAKPVRLLDLGCGNGWLSHRIAESSDLQVWALDRPGVELRQAARLFGDYRLAFLAADIFQPPFSAGAFDLILIASAIQYFPDLPALFQALFRLLSPRGELHVADSPVYDESDVTAARERTRAHYAELGLPDMADHYFHHTYSELEQFSLNWHYRPASPANRISKLLGRLDSPFPWFSLRPNH